MWEFTLRPGVKFHNGREMTAEDVKYSFERTIDPKTKSPGQGFYSNILGYDDMVAGKATTLSGVKIPDSKTVEITLKQPDASFLHIVAINFSAVVPKEEVAKYGEDFGKNPVGTGPYKFVSWDLGKQLVLERNPGYRERVYDAEPNADDAEGQAWVAKFKGRRLPMVDRVEVAVIHENQPMWLSLDRKSTRLNSSHRT